MAISSLTPRETEILELVVQGMYNKEIAHHLGIKYSTVKNHLTVIFRKLGVTSRTQAALYAVQHKEDRRAF